MKLKEHIAESLRLTPAPSPWPRMILSALSVALPLFTGVLFNDSRSSIYGALLGFILVLNDHFGPLKRRVLHLLTSFFFLALAFVVGMYLQGHTLILFPILFLMAFSLGKAKGLGLELERLLLFSTFQLLNGALTPGLQEHALKLLLYGFMSLVNYLLCLCFVFLLLRHKPNFQRSKREELKEAIRKKDTQRYAFTLAAISCFGLLIGSFFHVERVHWVVGTILIVMMPTKAHSLQKSFQRVFGTFLGVTLSSVLLYFGKNPYVLICYSSVAAFLAPLGLIRNYWLANVFIASLIMFLLEFADKPFVHNDVEFALLRFVDIALGSIIGAVGTFIAFRKSK